MDVTTMLVTCGGALGLCAGLAWLLDHAGVLLFQAPDSADGPAEFDSAAA